MRLPHFRRTGEFLLFHSCASLAVCSRCPSCRGLAYVPQNRNYKLASLISGLGLIAFSALLLDGSMAYPGFWALLPTLGAVLALSSNLEGGPISKLLSWRPIQFIGDVSYSIYLWHWPLIILLPFVVEISRPFGN